MKKLLAAVTVLAVSTAQAGVVIHVDAANCPGPGSGTERDPYCSIQTAIDNVVDTDEIVVAPGTYFEMIDFLGKAILLHSSDGPEVTIIDGTGNFHVVQCVNGEGPDTVLEGFTITGGNAHGGKFPDNSGGGMLNFLSTPTVTNCTFTENWAGFGGGMLSFGNAAVANCTFSGNSANFGGGLYNFQFSQTVTNCTFIENMASFSGGGMLNFETSPTVTDCAFRDNSAFEGGGVYSDGGKPMFTGCSFEGNTSNQSGAGMYNNDSSPAVTGCTIGRNTSHFGAGGGMYNDNSSATVTNCTFSENTADDSGGGMSSFNSGSTVTDCTFTGNIADDGAGLYSDVGTLTVNDSVFQGNVAVDPGQPCGGGIFTNDVDAMLTNCTFSKNSAGRGGALCLINTDLTLISCVIEQNSAPGSPGAGGGGVWVQNADALLLDCELRDNTSTAAAGAIVALSSGASPAQVTMVGCSITGNSAGFAGGLAVQDALAFVVNCTIAGNQALDEEGNFAGGGGVWALDFSNVGEAAGLWMTNVLVVGNSTAARGGGVYAAAEFSLANCTLSGNTAAESGGGVDAAHEGAFGTVVNSILWGNTPDQLLAGDGATTAVQYSDIEGGGFGETNIDADPLFIDSGNGDFRLQAGSPCIDAGNNWGVPQDTADVDGDGDTRELTPWDLDGNPRFNADPADFDPGCGVPVVVDMGAYEFQFDPVDEVFLGDLDGDGIVGIVDFLTLLADWGPCEPGCCLADLDIDGDVGITDFLLLLGNWTA